MSLKLRMVTGILFLLGMLQASAQTNIANYSFTATTGATYTPITGGTVFATSWDSNVSTAITMGGTFPFGGSNMTTCYISANGYVTFGASSSSSTPLSTLGSTTGAIIAFGQDGANSTATGAAPEIRYQNTGTEFVVQFKDHANWYNRASERLNFQIRLTYATGAINIVYGSCTNPGTTATQTAVQVGIRGNSVTYATNVNALMAGNIPASTTCDWASAVPAYANSSTLLFNGNATSGNVNVKIPTGLTYTWTPGTQAPVRTFSAVTGIGSGGATVAWTAPSGATGYNVQYRVPGTCSWTDWSGNPVATNTVTLTGLTPSTNYQVRVQAINGSVLAPYSHIPNAAGSGDGYTATGTFTTASTSPTLTAGTLTAFGSQCINSTYGPNSFTLTGTNLTSADVTVAASSGYSYSTTSDGTYTSTLTLTPSGGTLSQTVYVKFTPTTVATYNTNISISGGGASAVTVTPSGSGVNTTPTESVSSATAGSISLTGATISGATISALGCSNVTAYGIEYSTTSGFTGGTGTQVSGTGFSGAQGGTFSATLTGLTNGTTYYYRAYATNAGGTSYSSTGSFITLTANQIGSGTSSTSAYYPVYSNFGYSYSQQIYLASEINAVVTPGQRYITKIRFRHVSAGTVSTYNNWTVYMGNSSKNEFTTTSDWVPYADLTQVFTGTVTPVSSTWMEITLATPFLWDGTNNLVVAVDENAASFSSSTWQSYTASSNRAIQYYSDSINPDPASPPTSGSAFQSLTTNMSQIQFVTTVPPNCLPVTGISASATSYNAGTASWTAPSSGDMATGYEWEVRTSGTPGSGSPVASGTPAGTSATITGLTANTTYSFYVRTNCGGTYSTWSTAQVFATQPITAIASGDFATGSNWNNGTGPVCGQLALIPNGMAMTVTTGTANVGSLTINSGGSLTVSGGTLTVGCTGNNSTLSNSGTLTVSGGTLAVNGNIENASGATFAQSNGDIIIDGNDNYVTGTSVASGTPLLGFGTSSVSFATGTISLTGGTLTIVDPHTAATNTSAYALYAYLSSGVNFNAAAAHTVKFGDGISSQQGGNTSGFYWNCYAGSGRLNLGSVIVNNPSGTNRAVTQTGTNAINGNLTVTAGTFSQGTSTTNIGGNVLVENAGIFLTGGTTVFASTTGTTTGSQSTAQSVSVTGSGLIQNLATSPTANFASLTTYNTSATGVTINSLNQIVANSSIVANVLTTLTFNGKISTPAGTGLLGGTATTPATTITVNSGGMVPGSGFARGWNANAGGTQIVAGSQPNVTGNNFHPLADANGNGRYVWIERVSPTAAGILMVTYTDVAQSDITPALTESSYTINKRSAGKWTVSAIGTSIAATTYKIAMTAPAIFGATPTSTNVRVITADALIGTHQAGLATPHAQRAGLTLAQLTAQDFYLGIDNNDIPFYSVQTGNWEEGTTWNKGVAPTATDNVTISASTTVTAHTAASVAGITVNSGGILDITSNTLAVTNAITNNGTVNVAGGTANVGTIITNNASGTVNVSGGTLNVTSTATNGVANAGTFTLSSGTVNVGITNNTFANRRFTNTGTLTVSGGTMNIYGNLAHSGTAFNQSGGNINIDGNAGGVVANSVASGTYLLNLTSSNINWTGGMLTIVDPHTSATYSVYYSNSTAVNLTSGSHTLRLGDGTSTDAGDTTYGFRIYVYASTAKMSFRNLTVNGGAGATRFTALSTATGVHGTFTITSDSEFRDNSNILHVAGDIVNNGTYTSLVALTLGAYNNLTSSASTNAQTISGTGTFRNSTTSSTASLTSLTVNNSSTPGVTLSVPLSISGTLTLTAGKVNTTDANLLTLGTATAAGTLSGGSATAYIDGPFARTFAASRAAAAFGVANSFPVGKGSAYLPLNVDPVTTAGGAVVIKGEAFTSNSGTLATGVISLATNRWEALITSGSGNFTNATIRLGDASIVSNSKILTAATAAGEYHGIASAITYTPGTPNTISSVTAIEAADYTGYLSYGELNPCATPADQATSFVLISKSATTVTGSFTAAASAPSHYLVVAQPAANTPVAPVDFVTPTAASLGTGAIIISSGSTTTFSVSGLTANIAYNIYVYSYNNSGCYGPVFNTVSPLIYNFTTCSSSATSPGTVVASAITNNSFTATWTGPVGASYILEVATNSGMTNYVSGYNNVNIGTGTSTTITGLSTNVTYYVRVRSVVDDCASTNTGTTTVTTQLLVPAPYTEGFTTTTTPAGWTNGGTIGSTRGATGNPGNNLIINLYDDGEFANYSANFTTVNVGLLPSNYRLTFDYKLSNYSSPYGPVAAGAANFIVAISTNYGSSYTNLETVVNDGTTGWKDKEYDLSAYAGLPVKIRVTANYLSSGLLDFDIAFDNIKIDALPTCNKPTSISLSNMAATTATLNWVAPTFGTPVSYEYEVRTSGTPGSGVTGFVTSNTVAAPSLSTNITGLTANTTYYVYMRTFCGGSEYSTWSSATQFTTYCSSITALPHAESFNSAAFASCWTTSSNNQTISWLPDDANDGVPSPKTGARFAGVSWDSDVTTETLLVSPPYNISSNPYATRLSVWIYRNTANGLATDKTSFYVNSSPVLAGATTLLEVSLRASEAPVETVSGWYNYTATIPSSYITGGTFFIIAKGNVSSSSTSYSIGFDDYLLEYVPSTITNFTPTSTCSLAGETFTITGTNFTGATGVKFNGVDAASFNVVNSTTITAVAPSGVTSGAISVVGHANTATSTETLTVTVTPVVEDITGGDVTLCSGSTVQLVSSTTAGTGVWTSSDEAVAHVDINTGLLTAVGAGEATITYTATNGTCTVSKITSIEVNDIINITSFTNAQTITPGDSTQFSVVATGTGLTYKWYVSVNGGESYSELENDGTYSGVNTATLNIFNVDENYNGYMYHVVITGAAPCLPVTSDDAILGVSDIGITTQPQGVTLCGTGNADFTVVAEGTGLTYKWYENQGSGPQLITDGTVGGVTYSGANTATLSISNAGTVNNGWTYYVVVSDAAMAEAISGIVTLTVNTPPQVNSQPANGVVCYNGGTANFTVGAAGTGNTYQWQYATSATGPWNNVADATPAGVTYSGAATASLAVTTSASTPLSTYYYRAVVTGTAPCTTTASDAATLTFFTPEVTSQPAAAGVTVGQSTTFTVATSAPSPTYQWQFATSASGPWGNVTAATPAGTTYSGDTSATLTVNANTTAGGNSYYYRAVVTSGGCSVNSNSAQMTVTDYCATTFTNAAVNDYVTAMTITATTFSATPAQVTTAPYYSFLTGGTNTTTLYAGNTYTANLTVGSSATQNTGIWIDFNSDGDFSDTGEFLGSASIAASGSGTISIAVPAGVTLGNKRMRVRNTRTTTIVAGSACGNLNRGNTVDYVINIATAPDCTGTPAAAVASANTSTFCLSGSAILTATGLPAYVSGISLQWYNGAGAINGATSATYTTPTLTASETYYLRVTCTASGQHSDSNNVTITVNSPSVATTTPGERCGTGTVALGATGSAGTTLTWYAASTGGTALGTGTSFTTPSISTTTPYYVDATQYSSSATAGPANYLAVTGTKSGLSTATANYMIFSATSTARISTVTVYASVAGVVNLQLSTSGGTVLQSYSHTITAAEANSTTTALGTPIVIPVNFNVPVGTGLRLGTASGGTATLIRNESGSASYYNVAANGITFTSNVVGSTAYWYFFYNIGIESSCTSSRTQVNATVNSGPALTLSSSAATICNGTPSSAVTLTAGAGDYDSYQWTPSAGVSGDSSTGWTFNPSATTTYTLTASQSGGSQCNRTATITVTVNAVPTALTVTPETGALCSGEAAIQLSATGGKVTTVASSVGSGTAVNDASTTTNTSYPAPYGAYYENSKQQYLIRASELTALGFTAGTELKSITFDVTTLGTSGVHKAYTVSIGTTNQNAIATFETGLTTVFGPVDYQPVNGANTHNFATSYIWNGTSNIIVQVCHSNDPDGTAGSVFTANAQSKYSTTAFNSSLVYRVDSANACAGTTITYTQTKRPNMVFSYMASGSVVWSPTTGLYTDSGATVAYAGGNAATVYAKPVATTTYTATTTAASGCTATDTATITVSDKTWTGAVSTNWNTAGNWCGNTVPTSVDNVVVPNVVNKPVIDGNIIAVAGTLKIETGGTLTVKSGNTLTVTGITDIAAANGLVVENMASFKQVNDVANTGAGTALVHRNSSILYRNDFTLWSSPVANQGLFQFSPNTLPTRFYSYNESTDEYNVVPALGASSNTTFATAASYLIRMPDAQKVGGVPTGTYVPAILGPGGQDYNAGVQQMIFNGKYNGMPNNGNITFAAATTGNGYNAIGNPYPSPISVEAFFAANAGATDGTIYVWRKKNATAGSAYCSITEDGEFNTNEQPEAEDPQGILQVGQGFIVKATGPIVFNNGMRETVTSVNPAFFRAPATEVHRLRFRLLKGATPVAQTLVAYKNTATMGVDHGIDALFLNDATVGLNSMIGNAAYAIQGRALPFSNQDVVPMQFKADAAGSYTISLIQFDGMFAGSQNVYLRDKLLNVIHNIKGGAYTFSSAIGSFDDRFEVVYTDSMLGTDNPVLDPNSIVIWKNDNKLHIDSGTAVMKDIRIFDIRGRLVYEKTGVNATTAEVVNLTVQEEMLIVQVTTIDNAKVSKKVIY